MKKMMRRLCVFLCLALIAGSTAGIPAVQPNVALADSETLPAEAQGQETPASSTPQTPAETPAEATGETPTAEAPQPASEQPTDATSTQASSQDATATPETAATPEITATPEVTATPDVTATPEETATPEATAPAVDYAQDAGKSPLFKMGYALILRDDTPIYKAADSNAERQGLIASGVVYVLDRTSAAPDRLHISYNSLLEVISGWVDADRVRPMSPEEIETYRNTCINAEDARLVREDSQLPLLPVRYAADATATPMLSAEATIAPAEETNTPAPEDSITPVDLVVPVTMSVDRQSAVIGYKDNGLVLSVAFSDGKTSEDDGTVRTVSFASSNTRIAKVSANGQITGVKRGTATITATTNYGSASCTVTVKYAPKKVGLSASSATIMVGETMTVTPKFSNGYGSSCSFSSSNPAVATVDANGMVTGVGKGTAEISVRTFNNKTAKGTVTVYAPATAMDIPDSECKLSVGMKQSLAVTMPEYEKSPLTYISDTPAVVGIDAAGMMTANAIGSAKITVSTDNGLSDSISVTVVAAPSSISYSQTTLQMGLKETFDVDTLIQVTEGSYANYSYKSSNTSIITVNDEGVITAKRRGTAKIRVSAHNGLYADLTVKVLYAPKKVSASPSTMTLGVGMSRQLSPSYARNYYGNCSFASENPAIATVNESGMIQAVAAGTTTVALRTFNGKTANCTVTVVAAPDTISASLTSISIGVGESGRRIEGVYPQGTMAGFSFSSDKPEICSVDAGSGVLNGKAMGTAIITITSHNGKTAQCIVSVMPAPTSMTLSATTLILALGETNSSLTCTVNEGAASGLTLTSSNARIVQIVDGKLVAKRVGTATITAKTYNGITQKCKVTVRRAPSKVSFTIGNVVLGCGEQAQLNVSFPKNTYSICSYATENSAIAVVDANTGIVTGVNPGTTRIAAVTANNKRAVCTVTVYNAPASIAFANSEYSYSVGMSAVLTPVLSAGSASNCAFTSSNPAVATIMAGGKLAAVGVGETTITASTYNGLSATTLVRVSAAPASISFTASKVSMAKGDIVYMPELIAMAADGSVCSSSYTYKSSRSSIAAVSADGRVKALRNGTVTITAKSYNGKTATYKLTVTGSVNNVTLATSNAILFTDGLNYHETLALVGAVEGVSSGSISYSSANPNVATVGADGVVYAVAPGDTMITATAYNGCFAVCEVKVQKLSTTLSMPVADIELGVGESYRLLPVFEQNTSANVSYTSGDETVATVNSTGLIQAVSAGTAIIKASTQTGVENNTIVYVKAAPTGITLAAESLVLNSGESVMLNASLTGEGDNYRKAIVYTTSNAAVATVSADGNVTAVGEGNAKLTAKTCNGLKAECMLQVKAADAEAGIAFEKPSMSIITGDTAEFSVLLNALAIERGYTITSSDESVLTVDGLRITAGNVGSATLTLAINPAAVAEGETAVSEPLISTSCTVNVISTAALTLSASELTMYINDTADLSYTMEPADLVGTITCEVDSDLVDYDMDMGVVSSSDETGSAIITFHTFNWAYTCTVKVQGANYRSLIIAEYNNSGDKTDLSFASNNVAGVQNALGLMSINGQRYSQTVASANPSKDQIRSLLTSTFASATDNDVSVIYIVAHGQNAVDGSTKYGFALPGYSTLNPSSYVTADELFSWIKDIKGHVVLMLCTCYSGGFINQCAGQLSAEGNISVICSSHFSTVSSYFVSATPNYNVDFFTYGALYALGYEEQGQYALGRMYGDANGDGSLTVSEMFSYSAAKTRSAVYQKCGTSGFHGNVSQSVQYYIPAGERATVIAQR